MSIRPYHLRNALSVVLHKVIGRRGDGTAERIGRQSNRLDLTPYLGDGSTISTSKSIYAPLGSFTLTLIDRPEPEPALDTLYARIEPMDLIEIRFTRWPHFYGSSARRTVLGQGAVLPIIMRGFVRSVRRVQAMDDGGRPHRQVQISGADTGLLFNHFQILDQVGYISGEVLFDRFQMYQRYEIGNTESGLSAAEFMRTCARVLRDEYMRPLFAQAPAPIGFTLREEITVTEGTVVSAQIQAYEGSIWQLMERHADRPWNELFIEDREAGSTLVYRPTPFRDIEGKSIDPLAGQAQTEQQIGITVLIEDVQRLDVGRADTNLANLFWVSNFQAQLFGPGRLLQMLARVDGGDVFVHEHANSDPDLYGVRKLNATLSQAYTSAPAQPLHGRAEDQERIEDSFLDWFKRRLKILKEQNWDNVVFETGSATLKGNEQIRPGRYLDIYHGRFTATYYVTGVTHNWTVFGGFTTTVQLIRGTGFIERIKLNESPYWLEGRGGLYRD